MKSTILNELLDEKLVARINEYLNAREDTDKVTLRATVTLNVPVVLPVYKNGDYSGSNIYEDCLDCAQEFLDGASLRRITQGIVINAVELTESTTVDREFATPSRTMMFLNMSDAEWEATPASVRHKLSKYVYTQLNGED